MVDNDVLQEAGAVGNWSDAEVLRQRLAQVCECLSCPYIDPPSYVGAGFSRPTRPARNQHGDKLARMIRARRARIVAVVGGDHEHVRRPRLGGPRPEGPTNTAQFGAKS